METTPEKIEKEIKAGKVVIFMKGTPESPQCGFSARAVGILRETGYPFHTVDILANPDIRATLPQISNWPTFPQVFVDGKLIGGSDIVGEMYESGELQTLLKEAFKE
jgi:monothiol glutaredoxin